MTQKETSDDFFIMDGIQSFEETQDTQTSEKCEEKTPEPLSNLRKSPKIDEDVFCSLGIFNTSEKCEEKTPEPLSNLRKSPKIDEDVFCSLGIFNGSPLKRNGMEPFIKNPENTENNLDAGMKNVFSSDGFKENIEKPPLKKVSELRAEKFRDLSQLKLDAPVANSITALPVNGHLEKTSLEKKSLYTEKFKDQRFFSEKMQNLSNVLPQEIFFGNNKQDTPPENGLRSIRKCNYIKEPDKMAAKSLPKLPEAENSNAPKNRDLEGNENPVGDWLQEFVTACTDENEPKEVGQNSVSSKSTSNIVDIVKNNKRELRSKEVSDVCLVGEKSQTKEKKVVEHTVEDSDSDICIVDEEIRNPEIIKKRKKFRLHLVNKMRSQRSLKCSECNFKTSSMAQLRVHEQVHPKGRNMKCSKCAFETRIKSCMIYHAAMHSGAKKFRCSKCTFRTDSLNLFLKHESQKFSCSECSFTCHLKKNLNKHKVMKGHRGNEASGQNSDIERGIRGRSAPSRTKKRRRRRPLNSRRKEDESTTPRKTGHQDSKNPALRGEISVFGARGRRGRPRNNLKASRTKKKKSSLSYVTTEGGEYQCAKCEFVTDEKVFLENHAKNHERRAMRGGGKEKKKQVFKCSFCEFQTEFERMMESHLSTHVESDSDFDSDSNDISVSNIPVPEYQSSAVSKPAPRTVPTKDKTRYRCNDCDYETPHRKRLTNHRSLHLRKHVFDTIFSSFL